MYAVGASIHKTRDAEETLPTPKELMECYPLSAEERAFIKHSRQTITNILNGEDPRLLVIVGPCSIHDLNASREYAHHLKELAQQLSTKCFIVMRSYFEKPRTSTGWRGLLYDPHLDGSYDINLGLHLSRSLLKELAQLQVPAATEFLEIFTSAYLADLVSWGCIGARTTISPPHRQLAASLPFAVGFKNSPDGEVMNAVNALTSAASPQALIGLSAEGHLKKIMTQGNADCHIILRGGKERENYDIESVNYALELLQKKRLKPRLMIDCAHDNCRKIPSNQMKVFNNVIEQRQVGNRAIVGIMLESHLHEGHQEISQKGYGISITDPCLDWQRTQTLLSSLLYL